MGGGLLNLVAYGNLNVILNGNPSKTFFKSTYAKYTNFGLQKFRIDYEGSKSLNLSEESHFRFKVPRHTDLLMDTYLVLNLPTIWSPVLTIDSSNKKIRPYEFKWIKNLGSQFIKKVRFVVGGTLIQEYSGQYLLNMVERDFNTKKHAYDVMTGHIAELNDPANYNNRNGVYPNAIAVDNTGTKVTEPSIRAKKLYIPLNIWFTLASKMAFPLISLQYNELYIELECRPITELFVVRDIRDETIETPKYVKAEQTKSEFLFYRFLQTPPKFILDGTTTDNYPNKSTNWIHDIHLISTYAFLSEEEQRVFAGRPQKYLIKEVHEHDFYNVTGNKRQEIITAGLVSSWMWYFQRNDVGLRNEWSNYTNWAYDVIPNGIVDINDASVSDTYTALETLLGAGNVPDISMTGGFQPDNEKFIMTKWAVLLDGKEREKNQDAGVFNMVEKYIRSTGSSLDLGLYCYNFCLNTDPFLMQPTGAVNMSKFSLIEFEFSTYTPPIDPLAQTFVVCDAATNEPVAINKPTWEIYNYNYNMHLMEERYNILSFESGNAGLQFAR